MVELYFLFYRIPKMMGQLARQQGRSPILWGGAAMAAWIVAEITVIVGFTVAYAIASASFGLAEEAPPIINVVMYLFAIGSAIGSVALLRYMLRTRIPRDFVPPPPPQTYGQF